jgi:LacI family transcriptional regulator
LSRQPTIKDVATKAEVSFKTVSRVLNGEPHVRKEVRERVLAAAAALDYRPNNAARGLIGARSRLIGFLYDNPNYSYVTQGEVGALLRCRQAGYHLVVEPIDSQADVAQQIEQIISSLRLDGVILTPPISDDPAAMAMLDRLGVAHVRIAPSSARESAPCVFIDDEAAAYALTRHLIELGHRAIGFVQGHPDHGASQQRQAGFERAMEEAGLATPPHRIAQGYFTFESGMAAGRALLAPADRPTAVFAANDKMALGVLAAARELGLSAPADLALAGFDDNRVSRLSSPQLTTAHQPVDLMCAAAAEMLITLADGEALAQPTLQLPFEIEVRASSAAPAA